MSARRRKHSDRQAAFTLNSNQLSFQRGSWSLRSQLIIHHSGAREVWLRVTVTENILTISIEDNGRGIEKSAGEFANGLSNMKQRMADIGGSSRIDSGVETGTRVSLTFPKPDEK